jgi:hypothetical protein
MRFEAETSLERRLELAESIGDLDHVEDSGQYGVAAFARSGLDFLAAAAALAQLPEIVWAEPELGTVISWPGGVPPAAPPCDPTP